MRQTLRPRLLVLVLGPALVLVPAAVVVVVAVQVTIGTSIANSTAGSAIRDQESAVSGFVLTADEGLPGRHEWPRA